MVVLTELYTRICCPKNCGRFRAQALNSAVQEAKSCVYLRTRKKKKIDKPAGTTSGQQMDRQIKPTSLNWDETVCGHTLFMWQGVHIMFAMAAHKTVAFS